jgi:glycosyltransferase involved in cell wall biosynthesis
MQIKKLLIFNNADWQFYAHLLPIALAAKQAGYIVSLLTNVTDCREKIENAGIKVIPIVMSRKNINPFLELITLVKVTNIIRKEQPDILHNFTIKPIVYGSIASLFCKKNLKIINNFLGMGFVFISTKLVYIFIKQVICIILAIHSKLKHTLIIVQNSDDKQLIIDLGIAKEGKVHVQCSVGVDTENFHALKEPNGPVIFALVARMLIDKGIREFIAAAKILKAQKIEAEFWLVGTPDEGNKSSLSLSELEDLNKERIVKYIGFSDVSKIWKIAHVAVLPSYREGLSRSLLEAGAYGRAIITTDAPGGRELIRDKINGLLVGVQDASELAQAMEMMILNPEMRQKLGQEIRVVILKKYDSKIIAAKMLNYYR